MALTHRMATLADAPLLAQMNKQLIEDEGSRNPMSVAELEGRMRGWLDGKYQAILFKQSDRILAYALYQPGVDHIYLRQFFVAPNYRRQGIGRQAFAQLRTLWPYGKRLTVEVLWHNAAARAFWTAVGFCPYSLALEIRPQL